MVETSALETLSHSEFEPYSSYNTQTSTGPHVLKGLLTFSKTSPVGVPDWLSRKGVNIDPRVVSLSPCVGSRDYLNK